MSDNNLITNISNETNIVLQSVLSVLLLGKLNENDSLLKSDYFKTLDFGDKTTKPQIEQIHVGNQGMLLMWLYALLVVPKELLGKRTEIVKEFVELNKTIDGIDSIKNSCNTDYSSDIPLTDYIRHIRNAVSHVSVEYNQRGVVFRDKNYNKRKKKHEKFEVTIPHDKIMEIINKLTPIAKTYLDLLHKEQHTQNN